MCVSPTFGVSGSTLRPSTLGLCKNQGFSFPSSLGTSHPLEGFPQGAPFSLMVTHLLLSFYLPVSAVLFVSSLQTCHLFHVEVSFSVQESTHVGPSLSVGTKLSNNGLLERSFIQHEEERTESGPDHIEFPFCCSYPKQECTWRTFRLLDFALPPSGWRPIPNSWSVCTSHRLGDNFFGLRVRLRNCQPAAMSDPPHRSPPDDHPGTS